MSSFLAFSMGLVVLMLVLGWRIGWLTQLLWYALFGLFVSGFLLLLGELELIYEQSGVPSNLSGLTALITVVTFSALLVIPAMRVHKIFYVRNEIKESFREPGGVLLGGCVALLVVYSLGKSLMRYEIISPESEAYQSLEMRLIRAIDGNEQIAPYGVKTNRPEQ